MADPMIYLACDHGGFSLKEILLKALKKEGYAITDLGTHSTTSVDYPDYAVKVIAALIKDPMAKGILLCGTGIGMCMAANRYANIRAALCHTEYEAEVARAHNDANILCLGGRVLGPEIAIRCAQIFLKTPFAAGRHIQRIQKFANLGVSSLT